MLDGSRRLVDLRRDCECSFGFIVVVEELETVVDTVVYFVDEHVVGHRLQLGWLRLLALLLLYRHLNVILVEV